MRTTITLDADIVDQIKAEQARSRRSFKEVVNQALRLGLAMGAKPSRDGENFEVTIFRCGFQPGVDPYRLNQLADELEVGDFLEVVEDGGE